MISLLCMSICLLIFNCMLSGSCKVNKLLEEYYNKTASVVKKDLELSRKVVLTTDCWSKKSLTGSYMAISASFFHPSRNVPVHVLLNLYNIAHPHTGDMLAEKILQSLVDWNIPTAKILAIITDNGSNMIRAVKTANVLSANAVQLADKSSDEEMTSEDEESADNEAKSESVLTDTDEGNDRISDDSNVYDQDKDHNVDLMLSGYGQVSVTIKRLPCLAHTLQLVLKSIDKLKSYHNLILKARQLVRMVKSSSVATEKLMLKTGLTLICDCTTRWNSCYLMLDRMLMVKIELKEVLDEMKVDCPLLHSDWSQIDNIVKTLQPFKQQTDLLQSNNLSMSQIIPSLLELKLGLKDPTVNKQLSQLLYRSINDRFACFLDPDCSEFDSLPAAACLLDPSVGICMLQDDMATLLRAAKQYIHNLVSILYYYCMKTCNFSIFCA